MDNTLNQLMMMGGSIKRAQDVTQEQLQNARMWGYVFNYNGFDFVWIQ